jgi:hypothetical protein
VCVEPLGCGGIIADSRTDGGDGADRGYGTGGTPGNLPFGEGGLTGSSGASAKPTCGNGRIDTGEACDGAVVAGVTCASLTMGLLPVGTVACTKACQFATGLCRGGGTGGRPGTGGHPGTGGAISTGGFGGTAGDACYAAGGVPDPDPPGIACLFGDVGSKACYVQLSRDSETHPSCEVNCACTRCASEYARCADDGGCEWVLACARDRGCKDIKSCYTDGCSRIIDLAGGLGSSGARFAAGLLPCLAQSSCLGCQ